MYNTGLSVADRQKFESLLRSHHGIYVEVYVLNMRGDVVSNASSMLLDGQVTYDSTALVTRSLDLDLMDPLGALHLDSNSPDAGAMYADRMIRIIYNVIDPLTRKRYAVPVFTGPITSMKRSGWAVTLSALGKESLGTKIWGSKTYRAGSRVTDVIYSIMRDVIGENKISIARYSRTLSRNLSIGGDQSPWQVAKSLAASLGQQLFYDGNGVVRTRYISTSPAWTFSTGVGGTITQQPEIGYDISGCVNAVEVWGKKPDAPKKGVPAKRRPHWIAVAPRTHPLSPVALGGNGAPGERRPRYLPEIIEDEAITLDSQARDRANSRLQAGLLESLTVAFDSLPIPHLEEGDVARLATDKFSALFRVSQCALPLNAATDMSVGYARNLRIQTAAIRRR